MILHYVKQLKKFAQKLDSSPPAKGHAAPPALVEVAIKSNSLSFRVEAHPLEAWLALNGRLLRSIVMQRQVWQSAIGSAFSDDEDPDHGPGSGEAAKEWVSQATCTLHVSPCCHCLANVHTENCLRVLSFPLLYIKDTEGSIPPADYAQVVRGVLSKIKSAESSMCQRFASPWCADEHSVGRSGCNDSRGRKIQLERFSSLR